MQIALTLLAGIYILDALLDARPSKWIIGNFWSLVKLGGYFVLAAVGMNVFVFLIIQAIWWSNRWVMWCSFIMSVAVFAAGFILLHNAAYRRWLEIRRFTIIRHETVVLIVSFTLLTIGFFAR